MPVLARRELAFLNQWAQRSPRKPLVIRGARQVGKSTLVRQFAIAANLSLVEINFERSPEFQLAFAGNDPDRILVALRLLTGKKITAGHTLLFLDEIQAAPQALAALRYFYEEVPALHVVAAGSLLEFTLADTSHSMPVGRIEYLHLGPLQFEDFLVAMQAAPLAQHLQDMTLADIRKQTLPRPVHEKYLQLLKQFWITGGMPEAVATYADTRDFAEVARILHGIVATYRDDFNKYTSGSTRKLLPLVFDQLPAMVGRKFQYAQISRDYRAAELDLALQQLCLARVTTKVQHTAANGVPLGAEANPRYFKILCLDIGVMCAALKLHVLDLDKDDLSMVNKGALAEQFIGQHLLYLKPPYETPALFYWVREAKSAAAEMDYVLASGQQVVPLEIKAGTTGTLKSLHQFLKEKNRQFAVRFNADIPSLLHDAKKLTDGVAIDYDLLSLPLYMVGQLQRLLHEYHDSRRSAS